jgi:hypothetical protein
MYDLGISRWHPDPLTAIEEKKDRPAEKLLGDIHRNPPRLNRASVAWQPSAAPDIGLAACPL